MTMLTLDSFETALADLNNLVAKTANPVPIHHVVMNCHQSYAPNPQATAPMNRIMKAIKTASSNSPLYKLDLRTIYSPDGNPENWCLEACSKFKSLAVIGKVPTA